MKPIYFKESNKNLTKPSNMSDEECGSLHVFNDGSQSISLWKPSFKEVVKFLFYRKIWVFVIAGQTQPPISLSVEKTVFSESVNE